MTAETWLRCSMHLARYEWSINYHSEKMCMWQAKRYSVPNRDAVPTKLHRKELFTLTFLDLAEGKFWCYEIILPCRTRTHMGRAIENIPLDPNSHIRKFRNVGGFPLLDE
jgi:hypothetical protein